MGFKVQPNPNHSGVVRSPLPRHQAGVTQDRDVPVAQGVKDGTCEGQRDVGWWEQISPGKDVEIGGGSWLEALPSSEPSWNWLCLDLHPTESEDIPSPARWEF